MRVRNDLRNTEKFKRVLNEYKRDSIGALPVIIVMWLIFSALSGIYGMFQDGFIKGFIAFVIIFLIGCLFIGLYFIYIVIAKYKVIEIKVTKKEFQKQYDSESKHNRPSSYIYLIYDGKYRFYTEEESTYNDLLQDMEYLVVCRGKRIVFVYS